MLFSVLWAYKTSTKTAIGFTPFHIIHGEAVFLLIECQISFVHLATELLIDTIPLEKILVMLERTNEDYHVSLQTIEAVKEHSKAQYEGKVHPCVFHEGGLFLMYD
jgi:hypothetical protein